METGEEKDNIVENPFEGEISINPPSENPPAPAANEQTSATEETGDPVESTQENTSTYTPNNDFEGISIMSPDEINTQSGNTEEKAFIDNPDEKSTGTANNSSTNVSAEKRQAILKSVLSSLAEEGIVGELPDDFDGSIDSIKSIFETTVDSVANEKVSKYKDNFSGAKKQFLEIEDAFSDERLAMKVAQDLQFYKTVTPEQISEDENVQKALYAQSLYSRGFTQDKVEEAIEDAITLGKLEQKAQEVHPSLLKGAEQYVENSRRQKEAIVAQRQEQEQQSFNDLMESIDSREHMIKGLPFTKTHKDKVKTSMATTVYTDKNGRAYNDVGHKQFQNPKEFDALLHYYNSLGLFNVDSETGKFKPDLSKLKKTVKSDAVKELDNIIADEAINNSNGMGSGSNNRSAEEHTSGILNLLKNGFSK